MSVAFTKEDSAETASETLLPDRPVSPHPNLVTEAGLKALGGADWLASEQLETGGRASVIYRANPKALKL